MTIAPGQTLIALRDGDPAARIPGQHARSTVLRMRMRTIGALGILAVVTTAFGREFGLHSPLFVGAELALLATMFFVSRFVLPLLERRYRGATGEEHVGGLLDRLELEGAGWSVIHDASLGRGNIDHIALGPAGFFTVETKSHPGPVHVRSIHGAVLRQAQDEREALERVLDAPVEPLLVYSRAWVDKPAARRRGVRVLPARMLIAYLRRRRQSLSAEQVQAARERVVAALGDRAGR
ncbi:MAG TPA: nuclease-related domain-containing protein [Solirubrobacteraceae bacterium]|nr:nuclease-related domain-containing protein [Solirubrobacteraceae bacterium]